MADILIWLNPRGHKFLSPKVFDKTAKKQTINHMTYRQGDCGRSVSRRRFFIGGGRGGEVVVLDAKQSHHLSRVLRLGPGARVVVFDGRGWEAEAVIQKADPQGAVLQVVRELGLHGESGLSLTLAIGLAKGAAMDMLVCQATEMGVQRILPFISLRSERVTPERANRRLARWQRLAQETLKSCQRSYVPEIVPVQDFSQVLAGPEKMKLLFWEEAKVGGLSKVLREHPLAGLRVLIGPEGGFAPPEVAQAMEYGYQVVSLGPRRLKVETATLAALTILQFAWGDLA